MTTNTNIHDLGFDAFLHRDNNPLINTSANLVTNTPAFVSATYNDLRQSLDIDEVLQKTFTATTGTTNRPEVHEIMYYKNQNRTVTPFVISYVVFNLTGDRYQGRTPFYDVVLSGGVVSLNNYAFATPSTTGITCNATSLDSSITSWTFLHYVLRNKNGQR